MPHLVGYVTKGRKLDSFSKRVAAVAAVAAVSAAAVPAAQAATVETVARNLDNPRSVALGPDGAVYVANAGRAGRDCRGKGEARQCFGRSGRILRIDGGDRSVVAKSFASYGSPGGAFAAGVHGVSVAPDGDVFAVTGSGTPGSNSTLPEFVSGQAGRLFNVTDGNLTETARIHRTEWRQNTDGVEGDLNSNPYAVLALADRQIVVDAGANAVLEVRGRFVKVLSVIRGRGNRQAVPSSIALGPGGDYYVGELAESAGKGKARVWRVPAAGGDAEVYRSGFTAITGVAFADDGTMFVTEFARDFRTFDVRGRVWRVSADGSDRTALTRGRQLTAPTGLAYDDSTGALYVSNFSVLPRTTPEDSEFMGAGGTLVKITP